MMTQRQQAAKVPLLPGQSGTLLYAKRHSTALKSHFAPATASPHRRHTAARKQRKSLPSATAHPATSAKDTATAFFFDRGNQNDI